MSMHLSETIKALRKLKNISQETLATFLGVSYQAVSKWETGNSYPDISLLPKIARFFGVTVDELLQADVIDEDALYQAYETKAETAFRGDRWNECLSIWQEAYGNMPRNVDVKEKLMSAYYDVDKVRYQNEIIELGTEIYNSDAAMYYKGQAIRLVALTYAAAGNSDMAQKWASRATQLIHSQEFIYSEILPGDDILEQIGFANYWYSHQLAYAAIRFDSSETSAQGMEFILDMYRRVLQVFEAIYPTNDMDFDTATLVVCMRSRLAEIQATLEYDEEAIRSQLTKATETALLAMTAQEHLSHAPLLYKQHIQTAPYDCTRLVRQLQCIFQKECFDVYHNMEWFKTLYSRLNAPV